MKRPVNSACIKVRGIKFYIHDITTDAEELTLTTKKLEKVVKQISIIEAKLNDIEFATKANPDIVIIESKKLKELLDQREFLREYLSELKNIGDISV